MRYKVSIYLLLHSKTKSGEWVRRWKKHSYGVVYSKAEALETVRNFSTVESTKVTLQKLGAKHGKR